MFKIGSWHGRILSSDDKREYAIQRELYLLGGIEIVQSRSNKIRIRLIGYEVPTRTKNMGRACDLLGYDEQHNLWIIEVKHAKNNEPLCKAVEQVAKYCNCYSKKLRDLEENYSSAFFLSIKFAGVRAAVLAPNKFFDKDDRDFATSYTGDVLICRFGRVHNGDIPNISQRGKSTGFLQVAIMRK